MKHFHFLAKSHIRKLRLTSLFDTCAALASSQLAYLSVKQRNRVDSSLVSVPRRQNLLASLFKAHQFPCDMLSTFHMPNLYFFKQYEVKTLANATFGNMSNNNAFANRRDVVNIFGKLAFLQRIRFKKKCIQL